MSTNEATLAPAEHRPVEGARSGVYPPPRLSSWSVGWRYGLAILNYLVTLALTVASYVHQAGRQLREDGLLVDSPILLAADCLLGAGALALIRLRRRRPLATVLVISAMSAVASSCGLIACWALVSLATRRRWRPILAGATTFLVCSLAQFVFVPMPQRPRLVEVLVIVGFSVLTTVALVALGMFVGARRDLVAEMRERAETAEREQELRVLQGQASERNRIAREMHDVLAHRMSLVSMHAGALAFRHDLSGEETRQIAKVIQENAHASLTELRGVLGSLRDSHGVPAEVEKPQPVRLDVDDLVAQARAGGTSIDYVDQMQHPELLPSLVARHGYRIVQEALTNARKHAPLSRVCLQVSGAPGQGLTVVCRNKVPRHGSPASPGSRVGLLGVRERVDVTGGRMAVRQDAGEFELEVWLPW